MRDAFHTDDEDRTGKDRTNDDERGDQEVEEIGEEISDDPVVEEDGETYDPAAQAPLEAER